MNSWCWTYDPRESPSLLPFDLFDRQAEFLRWLWEREKTQTPGVVGKSRDMGASWLCCAYALHRWLFATAACTIGFGSRKLAYVDARGDPKTIFEKIRMLLDLLPGWMRPAGFKEKAHSHTAKLVNPQTGSTITGEGGDQIGRGDRTLMYLLDESAFIEHPHLVERSLSQTTRVRIDVSTPNGPGNPFAQKLQGGRVSRFTLHWRDDPRKGDAWYARQQAELDAVTLAQEVDIDCNASVEGIVIPAAWVQSAVLLRLPLGARNVAGFDIAEMGNDLCAVVVRSGPVVFTPQTWGKCNTTESAHRAREYGEAQEVATMYYEVDGLGTGVRGAWDTAEVKPRFVTEAVNSGGSPTDTPWPGDRTAENLFLNRRAELWWGLRRRFEKTYEAVTQGKVHDPMELISIPDDRELIAQLSLPLAQRTSSGRIKIEAKGDMRKRGVKSPDKADALALAFHPDTTWEAGWWRVDVPVPEAAVRNNVAPRR